MAERGGRRSILTSRVGHAAGTTSSIRTGPNGHDSRWRESLRAGQLCVVFGLERPTRPPLRSEPTELRQLAWQIAAHLHVLDKSRHSFDVGLAAAQRAAGTITEAITDDGRFDLTPAVMQAFKRLEATLDPGEQEPELAAAAELWQRLRGSLVHTTYTNFAPPHYSVEDAQKWLRAVAENLSVEFRRPSRRTRCAADLALRFLPPVDRQRYREEWAAELANLPRRDQAPYAFRLLSHAWWLRRELSSKPHRNPRNVLIIVGVVIPGADAVAALCGLDWPAAVVGLGWAAGLGWVVSSQERTQHLIALIREARSNQAPSRK